MGSRDKLLACAVDAEAAAFWATCYASAKRATNTVNDAPAIIPSSSKPPKRESTPSQTRRPPFLPKHALYCGPTLFTTRTV